MKINKRSICIIFIAFVILAIAVILTVFNKDVDKSQNVSESNNQSLEESTKNSVNITDDVVKSLEYDEDEENVDYNIETYINIEDNKANIQGEGAQQSNGVITINKAGNYSISGTLANGKIIVDVDKDSIVKILLDNVNITSSDSSPIFIKSVKKCIITSKSGTKNYLTDATEYVYDNSEEDEPKATIFSKDDLILNGEGTLIVKANYNDAISSNDAIRIFNANIEIDSIDDGIRGKDYIYVKNSNIKLEVYGDALKSTNEESNEVGFMIIENSNLNINAGNDGLDSVGSIYIKEGTYTILTGEGSANSQDKQDWGFWGREQNAVKNDEQEETKSAKGIKSSTNICIDSGNFNIDSSDDSIHSNNIITINGGDFVISSGDDGIHSDTTLNINSGKININKSYEGIESAQINITGGNINIVSSDDGINVAGGNDSSSIMGRPGQNNFNINENSSSEYNLNISGADIVVNASGDGIDSNGNIYITGGNITVFGPTDNANGALDYDNTCKIDGGSFVMVSTTGMLQTPSSSLSDKYCLTFTLSRNYNENSNIVIKDSNNNEVLNITAKKTFNMVYLSNDDIE